MDSLKGAKDLPVRLSAHTTCRLHTQKKHLFLQNHSSVAPAVIRSRARTMRVTYFDAKTERRFFVASSPRHLAIDRKLPDKAKHVVRLSTFCRRLRGNNTDNYQINIIPPTKACSRAALSVHRESRHRFDASRRTSAERAA